MSFVYLVPVLLSFLLLAAHFLHAGNLPLVAVALLLPLLLLIRRGWVVRVVQTALLVGALEWLRTIVMLIDFYEQAGRPWTRMSIILGSVLLFTLAASTVFFTPHLRRRYWRNSVTPPPS
ncbi:hypothetical protein [Fontivita pretiosa]|uniref:hypothetical protein n=1 Tax=Fontivita pretiosa TaxID=2989684 RepID=UPI003D17604B